MSNTYFDELNRRKAELRARKEHFNKSKRTRTARLLNPKSSPVIYGKKTLRRQMRFNDEMNSNY